MVQPRHAYKAQFFQALSHPLRIWVVDLLRDGPRSVSDLQAEVGDEASNVSQQLAVLRRQHIVQSHKRGTSVFYEVTDPLVFEILDVARRMFQNHVQDMQSVVADE